MIENRNESELYYLRLLFRYIFRRMNFQHFLYFSVFLTFDIGDAVSAAMMMESRGINSEYNIIVKHIFVNYGLSGLIAAKLFLIIVPLIIASMVVDKSYWLINGILIALIIGGLMATQANIQAMTGLPHMNPGEINMLYLKILLIFSATGMLLDSFFTEATKPRIHTR